MKFRSPKVMNSAVIAPTPRITAESSSYETQEELLFACLAFVILLAISTADVIFSTAATH